MPTSFLVRPWGAQSLIKATYPWGGRCPSDGGKHRAPFPLSDLSTSYLPALLQRISCEVGCLPTFPFLFRLRVVPLHSISILKNSTILEEGSTTGSQNASQLLHLTLDWKKPGYLLWIKTWFVWSSLEMGNSKDSFQRKLCPSMMAALQWADHHISK